MALISTFKATLYHWFEFAFFHGHESHVMIVVRFAKEAFQESIQSIISHTAGLHICVELKALSFTKFLRLHSLPIGKNGDGLKAFELL